MDKADNMKTTQIEISPGNRLHEDFPAVVWGVGWISILKAIMWIFTSPVLDEHNLNILFYKYVICTIPFIVFGFGIWNLKKWAVWGLLIFCVFEALLFIFYPVTLKSFIIGGPSPIGLIFTAGLLITIGPIGTLFILINIPFLFKCQKKYSKKS